ncbi:MAG: ASCH domain-containing protein [Vulcanimicrobiaceae bacterium]
MFDFANQDVLFSIKPAYADKILDGRKTVELRRRFTDSEVVGSLAFIYSTSPVRELVGYARIRDVRRLRVSDIWHEYRDAAGIDKADFDSYFEGRCEGYVIVLDEPMRLADAVPIADLRERFGFVPPQSFRYVPREYHALIRSA